MVYVLLARGHGLMQRCAKHSIECMNATFKCRSNAVLDVSDYNLMICGPRSLMIPRGRSFVAYITRQKVAATTGPEEVVDNNPRRAFVLCSSQNKNKQTLLDFLTKCCHFWLQMVLE
uniref:Uncharacterized protein n=1 Tax=Aplanochytrium stocchinoi TaxID=215587 RepID=A0A7S3LQA3_9STRA|mmetsp:Transcript_30994/g.38278  ORF Transcript_30994/g.38278 Transcript_30994/m.38278 type:complete len:117 (-) Transcript_30994:60-410(-)